MYLRKYTDLLLCLLRNCSRHYDHVKYFTSPTANEVSLSNFDKEVLSENESIDHSVSSFENNQASRKIPLTNLEHKDMMHNRPEQPENPHCLKVAILGEPNAGKSTLTNALTKWKVCAVSQKVHTTRKKSFAIMVNENKQIVFVDTPGFVTRRHCKKHNLEPSFIKDPQITADKANLLAVIIDFANKWDNNKINPNILKLLNEYKHKKSILILNKIDKMKSKDRVLSLINILTEGGLKHCFEKISFKELTIEEIFEMTRTVLSKNEGNSNSSSGQLIIENKPSKRGWPHFDRVFLVSALKNDGIDELREYLFNETQPGKWIFSSNLVTNITPSQIALDIVREKLLEYLPQEIPYNIKLKINNWEILPTGCPKIEIKLICKNSRHKTFVIGRNGKGISACVAACRYSMREAFRKDVILKLAVV